VSAVPRGWTPSIPDGRIDAADVHAWLVSTIEPPVSADMLSAVLSPDERARAARFRFERDRRRFVAARGLLRMLLSTYAGREPASLVFEYEAHGKPRPAGADGIAFNVSHSGDVALYAVTRVGDVGVDVEAWRPLADRDDLAARFFAPGEVRRLQALDPDGRQAAFFACWTRKEAFVKAIGEGLSHPLDRFEVSIEPGGGLVHVGGDAAEAQAWTLVSLPAPDGYAAALALRATDVRVTCRAWGDLVPPPEARPFAECIES
jgi:4'-phosphopantetheinyl transferase